MHGCVISEVHHSLEIIMIASTQANFFNLHLSGVGYINRIRWVNPSGRQGRRAEPFLACSIAALRGKADGLHLPGPEGIW